MTRPSSPLSQLGPKAAAHHRDDSQALFRERCQEAKALGIAIMAHKQVLLLYNNGSQTGATTVHSLEKARDEFVKLTHVILNLLSVLVSLQVQRSP
jgi:hypothetical protein